jgi:hypothetical protein
VPGLSAWFQYLILESEKLVSKFAFEWVNLCRYAMDIFTRVESPGLDGRRVVGAACGRYHTAAITSDGGVYTFGLNDRGWGCHSTPGGCQIDWLYGVYWLLSLEPCVLTAK